MATQAAMEGCIWHVTVPSSMRFCVDESASWETGEDALKPLI